MKSFLIFLSFFLVGCGVKKASAPHKPILISKDLELRKFPAPETSWILRGNKLFFWPENATQKDVHTVLHASFEYDKFNNEASSLVMRRDEIDTKLKDLGETEEKRRLEDELIKIEDALAPLGAQGQEELKKIEGVVKHISTPGIFSIGKSQKGLEIKILGWDLKDGKGDRNFSTTGEKPNIIKVSYVELGGILEFDVVTDPATIIRFHMSRTNYSATDDGVYFGGEIIRNPDSKQARRGIVKLATRSN